jgi:hypothetical protein
MVERADPGRAGVKAGRLVGVLTAAITVTTLVSTRGSFYEGVTLFLESVGGESSVPVSLLFWGNAVFAGLARYGIGYVVGSLVGVLYDWLDRPPWPAVAVIALLIGLFDAGVAFLDTFSVAIAGAYVLAWLCYVPAFAWLVEDDVDERSGPRRLGEDQS